MADCEVPAIAASRACVTWTCCLNWRMMFTTRKYIPSYIFSAMPTQAPVTETNVMFFSPNAKNG